VREHDVVYQGYAKDVAGGLEAVGYLLVFHGGFQAATGVVVGDEDGAGPVCNGLREDFTRMDYCSIYEAYSHNADGYDVVGAIEGAAEEAFLLAVVKVAYQLPGIGGTAYMAFPDAEEALAEFQGCGYAAGPGTAQALDFCQIVDTWHAGAEIATGQYLRG